MSRRQAERWSQQGSGYAPVQRVGYAQEEPPAAAPAPAEPPARDIAAQLTDLAQLKEQGVLTEQEFAAQKARVLGT